MSRPTSSSAFTRMPVLYAECNAPGDTDATPGVQTAVPWDTFYDVNQEDLSGILPAGCGLSYEDGLFTALEDLVLVINLGVDINASPGDASSLLLSVPSYGYSPVFEAAASGNPSRWQVERTFAMHTGENFRLLQSSTGSAVTVVDGYAAMDIVRIAGGIE